MQRQEYGPCSLLIQTRCRPRHADLRAKYRPARAQKRTISARWGKSRVRHAFAARAAVLHRGYQDQMREVEDLTRP